MVVVKNIKNVVYSNIKLKGILLIFKVKNEQFKALDSKKDLSYK